MGVGWGIRSQRRLRKAMNGGERAAGFWCTPHDDWHCNKGPCKRRNKRRRHKELRADGRDIVRMAVYP